MSMKRTNRGSDKLSAILISVLTLTLALTITLRAEGQIAAMQSSLHSSHAAIQLNAALPAQLRLSLSDINLDFKVTDPTQSSAVIAVPVTSSWVLDSSSNNVELVGFFDSPAAAMQDNAGHTIPANHVLAGLADEVMMPFVETSRVGTANASRSFFRQRISRQNVSDTRTDTLKVLLSRIDDLGAPASEYRGVLHLRLISY